MTSEIFNQSEVDSLRKVIIHRPDDGLEVITPSNALELLYDDIVFLRVIQEEHKIFETILKGFIGKSNVYDTQQLLTEVLENADDKVKDQVFKYLIDLEELTDEEQKVLRNLPIKDLVYTLFTGILGEEDICIFDPLPNYVFTRDIGVVIKDYLLITNPSKLARKREAVLTRCICYFHPIFKSCQENNDAKIIDMTKLGDEYTIEGGDVMVFNDDYLLLGSSERTTDKAIESLKNTLFGNKVIKNIVKISIPKDRSCMHIDTLFTQISENEFVVYKPTLESTQFGVILYSIDGQEKKFASLKDFFLYVNPKMEFIFCGDGESPYDEREQWTDGCNLVAIKDGVAIAYDRNVKTANALKKKGYQLVNGIDIVQDIFHGRFDASEYQKTIIQIPSTELSRARGGPHCMTFPVWRN